MGSAARPRRTFCRSPRDRPSSSPAPTLRSGTGGAAVQICSGCCAWTRNQATLPRSADEPAPTIHRRPVQLAAWVTERPATLSRATPPGRPGHKYERGESQFETDSVRITVQEAAILQSFPADYPWQGSKTAQFTQVGNAIPVLLAMHILAEATGIPVAEQGCRMKGLSAASRAVSDRNIGMQPPGAPPADAPRPSSPYRHHARRRRRPRREAAQKALEDRPAGRVLARLLMTAGVQGAGLPPQPPRPWTPAVTRSGAGADSGPGGHRRPPRGSRDLRRRDERLEAARPPAAWWPTRATLSSRCRVITPRVEGHSGLRRVRGEPGVQRLRPRDGADLGVWAGIDRGVANARRSDRLRLARAAAG